MFAFTKEQKQKKLANQYCSAHSALLHKLGQSDMSALTLEAVSNARADIVDGFTMLRTTYSNNKVKSIRDFRLLRVPGMPGIVLNYDSVGNGPILHYTHIYAEKLNINGIDNVKDYLVKALLKNKRKLLKQEYSRISAKYSITLPFTISRYNTLVCLLLEYTQEMTELDTYMVVSSQYDIEICEQFAHHNNIDILISI